jgi:hypothetical protein
MWSGGPDWLLPLLASYSNTKSNQSYQIDNHTISSLYYFWFVEFLVVILSCSLQIIAHCSKVQAYAWLALPPKKRRIELRSLPEPVQTAVSLPSPEASSAEMSSIQTPTRHATIPNLGYQEVAQRLVAGTLERANVQLQEAESVP